MFFVRVFEVCVSVYWVILGALEWKLLCSEVFTSMAFTINGIEGSSALRGVELG